MEPYSISAVIQLYSAGLISRAALEREANTFQQRPKMSEARMGLDLRDDDYIDLSPDANGVWRLH